MLERLLLVIVLAVVGVAAYLFWTRYHARRVSQMASLDPILGDFRPGIPAIVLFTNDFCQPCKTLQIPALRQIQSELEVQVIQIDCIKQADAAERWGVFSVPTTFVMDGSGKAREINYGVADANKLRQQLQAIRA